MHGKRGWVLATQYRSCGGHGGGLEVGSWAEPGIGGSEGGWAAGRCSSSERAAERGIPLMTEHRARDLRRDGDPGMRTAHTAADCALVPTGQRGVLPPPPAPSSLFPRAPPRVSTAARSPAEPRTAPGAAAARRRRPEGAGSPAAWRGGGGGHRLRAEGRAVRCGRCGGRAMGAAARRGPAVPARRVARLSHRQRRRERSRSRGERCAPGGGDRGAGGGDARCPLPSQAVCRSSFRSPSGALLAARAKVMREVCLLLPCCGVPVLPPGLGAPKVLKQDSASPRVAVLDVMLCGYRRMQPRVHPFHPSCCGCSSWMVHLQVVPAQPRGTGGGICS